MFPSAKRQQNRSSAFKESVALRMKEEVSEEEISHHKGKNITSSMIFCQQGCDFCIEENGARVNCFLGEQMQATLSVLRVQEEKFGFLRVVSRLDLGSQIVGIGLDPMLAFPNLGLACPSAVQFRVPEEEMMFCIRNKTEPGSLNQTEQTTIAESFFESLPLGIFEAFGTRQLPALSTAQRVEAKEVGGGVAFLSVGVDIMDNDAEDPTASLPMVSLPTAQGDFRPNGVTCTTHRM
ncbi:hypothetical protein BWQ96_05517 [Gracilariopsis chorda]|uniref:Uncharacterized protein n=1 Tax=Gracilariopsis chorda TaxID=448386 RepID=A0A2V3IRM0_9FLOR|nr:hypothetical protein BWQ96_05517 [Gracilariopsis chorda]|eukprot:PXF44758.1 hypothetical protein BWQ96_05517 [Gracilariopsis chorda]